MDMLRTEIVEDTYLADWCDHETVHAGLGIEHLLFDEARIDDVVNAIDGQRCFRDVRGNDHLMER